MVLAMAMSLAGLNPEEFKGVITKLTPSPTLRLRLGEASWSESLSTRSESSGISSTESLSPRSLEGSIPWPFPSSSMEHSGRSTDGNSLWPTPSSSTALSVSSNGESTSSLTPSSRTSSVFSIDIFPSSLTPISSGSSTPMEVISNNEMVDRTLVEVSGLCHNVSNVAVNPEEAGLQDVKP